MVIIQSIQGTYFSASIPDVVFTLNGSSANVTVTIDKGLSTEDVLLSETLSPIDGRIVLRDLSQDVGPSAEARLVVSLSIDIEADGTTQSMTAKVIFSQADIGEDAATFCQEHFLTLMMGTKITAIGRLEYLHYIGTEDAVATAYYTDGTNRKFMVAKTGGNDKYTTIDVSPALFTTEGTTLWSYSVSAGNRLQRFYIDLSQPDCAPVLLFTNSFGVQELAYCTGTHEKAPEFSREATYIEGKMTPYLIEEVRKMKADTGILTTAMAEWWDECFRSKEIYLVNFLDGFANVGKAVYISDCKSVRTNADDDMPRFTFTWQYAQHNHNVVAELRAGRIFDNTFDNTFN